MLKHSAEHPNFVHGVFITKHLSYRRLRVEDVPPFILLDKWVGACTKFGTIVFQHHVRGVRLGERVAAEPNKQNAHISRFS
mmetsp:Transcript_6663/g.30105  ORF Transcript_6663/g.30105 Transcript_6663/m.30105 type:complete len:81 (+) Transcript_6663:149-391(+)